MKTKLNENAQAWVAALRSGAYTKTKDMLHRVSEEGKSSFCNLGVGCDLYTKFVGGKWGTIRYDVWADNVKFTDDEGVLSDSDLTPAVMDWLGLTNSQGAYCDVNGKDCTLVKLNDKDNLTFAEIADAIESQPEGLFRTE